jgi:hypothetical protein
VLATGAGRVDVQFGDHSAFSLGPRSTLELRRFDAEQIALVVDGTVDITVAPRAPHQRFLVIAGDRTVEVRGTQFRVSYDRTATRVACRHGKVAVRDAHGEVEVATARKLELAPAAPVEASRVGVLGADELEQLAAATPATMPLWGDPQALLQTSAALEVTTVGAHAVRVDGVELGEAPLRVRVMPGRHTVETAGPSGRYRRAGWVDAQPAQPTRLEVAPDPAPATAAPVSSAQRRKELATGIAANRARLARCTRAAAKSGISDLSVQIEISVDAAGAVRFLNVDSDLTAGTQACIHDALTQIQFGAGPAATWREKIDL